MGHILRVKPVFKEMLWGGSKLHDVYGYDIPSNHTGECWAISAHPNGDCQIVNDEFEGMTLSCLYEKHRELFGDIDLPTFPLLVKIIDANKDLSVQVHPDDAYAKKYENSLGKTECWYVLQADEHTQMVMGHHAKTKQEFEQAIHESAYDALLNRFEIKEGDFYYIPSGTLHAICSGSLIYEAQQSSDITYRIYDYDRRDQEGNKRQLHVKQSIDVTNVPADLTMNSKTVKSSIAHGIRTLLVESEFFTVTHFDITGKTTIHNDKPFMLLSVIKGNGSINGCELKLGDHIIICSDVNDFVMDGNIQFMITSL